MMDEDKLELKPEVLKELQRIVDGINDGTIKTMTTEELESKLFQKKEKKFWNLADQEDDANTAYQKDMELEEGIFHSRDVRKCREELNKRCVSIEFIQLSPETKVLKWSDVLEVFGDV